MIYLLSCNQYNVQYVREVSLPLHQRNNLHRSANSRYEYVTKHLKDVCVGASLSVQITEVFPGTG